MSWRPIVMTGLRLRHRVLVDHGDAARPRIARSSLAVMRGDVAALEEDAPARRCGPLDPR